MKKIFMVVCMITLGIGLALGEVPPVYAQEEFTLEEITVTAQKREENQQNVAVAMEVISSDTIKELGRTDLEQIFANISNIIVTREGGGMKVSLRGMSNDLDVSSGGSQPATPTVAVNFDGISSSRMDQGFNLYDLERVEVLFGPQATLYSTNTPGGIVNVITAGPKLDVFEGSGTLEYGNYGLLHTEGAMNVPINDISAVRAAFSTLTHEGYNSNGTNDEDAKSARLRYLFQPNERVSFIATGEYQNTSSKGFAAVENFVNQSDKDNPWTSASSSVPSPTFSDRKKLYGQFQVDAGIGTISLLPSYVTNNSSLAGADRSGNPTQQDANMRERSMETRMASNEDSPFTYIFGLSYYSTKDTSYTTTDDPPTYSWSKWFYESKSKAAYGNVTYPFTDVFRVTGGVRHSWDEFRAIGIEYPPPGGFAFDPPSIEDGLMEYDGTDYKVGIEYDIGEDVMFYTDYSTSYRTQGRAFEHKHMGTEGEVFLAPFPPEKLTAYNAGLKSRFFGNKLQLNVAGYFYDYKDYFARGGQASITRRDLNGDGDYDDIVDGQAETYRTSDSHGLATGDAEVYGADVMASMIITNKDKLDVSIAYVHKEFTRMLFDWEDITNEIGIPDLDLSGQRMTFAPEWTINANYSHNFSLANGGVLTARVDSKYVSEFVIDWNHVTTNLDANLQPYLVDTTDIDTQEAYMMSNFTMVYTDPSGNWTISGYVKNIENYAAKVGGGWSGLMVSAPRTYGAILTVRY